MANFHFARRILLWPAFREFYDAYFDRLLRYLLVITGGNKETRFLPAGRAGDAGKFLRGKDDFIRSRRHANRHDERRLSFDQ